MTTTQVLPDAGSYVEMTAADEQAARVRVVHAEGAGLTLSAPLAAVPGVGAAVTLRWSSAPRGRYGLSCAVLGVDENRREREVRGAPMLEQHRPFLRRGGGAQVTLHRPGSPAPTGCIRDISEPSMRAHLA